MAKRGKTQTGTDINTVQKQNAASAEGKQYDVEFAAETNVQEVKRQNAQSAQNSGAGSAQSRRSARNIPSNSQFSAEFASETDVQQVKKQNAKSQKRAKKNQ